MLGIVYLFAAAFLLGVESLEGASVVAGRVTDDRGRAIPGAQVDVMGTTVGGITNRDGEFLFRDVPAGEFFILPGALAGWRNSDSSVWPMPTRCP